MDAHGFEPSDAKSGVLAMVFGKIVWRAEPEMIGVLQKARVVAPFKYVPRALNTKVLAMPWVLPRTKEEAKAQLAVLAEHGVKEAHGFVLPEMEGAYQDEHGKPAAYLDGGELVVAFARVAPERLAEAMPYLRAPQRQDWFMSALAAVAAETKNAKKRALVYDAIASMAVPAASNKHKPTYLRALTEGAAAYLEAGDAASAKRLEEKAGALGPKKKK